MKDTKLRHPEQLETNGAGGRTTDANAVDGEYQPESILITGQIHTKQSLISIFEWQKAASAGNSTYACMLTQVVPVSSPVTS